MRSQKNTMERCPDSDNSDMLTGCRDLFIHERPAGAITMAIATKHILITEDDVLVQKTLKFSLEEAGYTVGSAGNGREAILYVETKNPDAILLDVFMPESDGIEALITIKRQFPNIKVIVMSGGGMKGHFEFLTMAKKLGADGVLRKPIMFRDLVSTLETAFQ
jgi:CheY-like chemotaxis protein